LVVSFEDEGRKDHFAFVSTALLAELIVVDENILPKAKRNPSPTTIP